MSLKRDDATEAQVRAADPSGSTWLSANAGSGKTRVLTDRVARLLLQNVDPQQILCLTYTKAAASEMQNRLFQRLGEWAMKGDAALVQTLRELGIEGDILPSDLGRARTLFARAIETPGGLKIQTIHSFCAGVLRRFPLEAGVNPQFQEMEDRAAELLRADIVDEMVEGADQHVVQALAKHFSGENLSKLTNEIVRHQDGFAPVLDWDDVAAAFGLNPNFGDADLDAILFQGGETQLIAKLIPALLAGAKTDIVVGERLQQVPDFTAKSLPALAHALLTQAGTPIKRNPTKKVQEAVPDLMPDLQDFMARVAQAVAAQATLQKARKTHALHQFAGPFLERYRQAKQIRGWLDFDDLILLTRGLLANDAVAAWVLYRLDGGINHILVDEAQDTSPAQWDVIRKLAQEFTSGQGVEQETARTIFVVGDKKQSIYSFQGADPDEFDRMESEFQEKLHAIQAPFRSATLDFSFRSSDAILRLVDATFDDAEAAGFVPDQKHRAFHTDKPGRVDLWPVVDKSSEKDDRVWTDPVDRMPPTHHSILLARDVADQIAQMLDKETPAYIPEPTGQGQFELRPVQAGDIMVLVQRRSAMFHEIIRACKERELPIAGADRLRVGGELAVRDLLTLMTFLATPDDSLSLATILRSPLAGWSEKQLFDLANPNKSMTLWEALRRAKDQHPETFAMLEDLRGQIDFLRPYDLLERILTRHRGREKLLARLGPEAEDGIDAVLSQALSYERSSIPSLTGFLSWAQADELEIKRQVDSAGNLIRVMTVHGAKGLEAPIVILPDCGRRDLNIKDELLKSPSGTLWKAASDTSPDIVNAAIDERKLTESKERQRLLYVAMTRAETWLIVAAAGDLAKDGGDWYQSIQHGMEQVGAKVHDFGSGTGQRYEYGQWDWPKHARPPDLSTQNVSLDAFYQDPVSPPPDRKETLSPSDLDGAKALASSLGLAEDVALARGTFVHVLLELLSMNDTAKWPGILSSIQKPDVLTETQITDSIEEAKQCLTRPDLAWVFDPSTLAEVPVHGKIGETTILGIIDRLIVEPDCVTAVDFKTNIAVPDYASACPEGILRQMGAYAHVLAQIYSGRKIKTGILWTASGTYMSLPQNMVNDALARSPRVDATAVDT